MQPEQLSYEDYRDSLVVFADVLGMSREILSIDDEQSFKIAAFVLQLLREQARSWRSMDGRLRALQATAVSDSLIISIPWQSEVGASALIAAMSAFQYDLLWRGGHLLRGYLARGQLYHKDEFVFGEGYIRAWKGEEGLKNGPPRIVLDPELAAYALERGEDKPPDGYHSAFEYLHQDPCDGLWFIDYLKPVGTRKKDSAESLRTARGNIREWIKRQQDAYQADHHVGSKYHWLEQYEITTRAGFEALLLEREGGRSK
jgi:hypothetical protein